MSGGTLAARSLLVATLIAGLLACSNSTSGSGLQVVATTGVLADVIEDLVGEHGRVEALMEPGTDPHEFTPSASHSALLRSADLVVVNGLSLEAGMDDMLEAAAADGARLVDLAARLDPLPFGDEHAGEEDHDGEDPHFVLDPLRVADAVTVAAEALSEVDPSVDWTTRAESLRSDLQALHQEIEDILSSVPPEARKLVTNHDTMGYFADRYGFEVVGTVIPGGSTLAEPSASDLAELADLVRRENLPAIFAESTAPTTLAETVAAEAGGSVGVFLLYTESLGPEGSGADDYAGMMRTNAATIAEALGDGSR